MALCIAMAHRAVRISIHYLHVHVYGVMCDAVMA